MADTSLRQDIAAAMEADDAEVTEPSEDPVEDASTPDASDGGQPEGTDDDVADEPEAPAEGTEDIPSEYFGLDLSGVEPNARAAFIAELQKRDDYIGKLLRDKEPASADAPPVEQPEPEAFPSDEEILNSLGLDPEDPFQVEQAKLALPLAKQQLQQQQALSALVEQAELADLDRYWRESLSGLEREFGVLPKTLDHDRVMEFAAENGIGNPLDAYWRIVGPGRDALAKSLEATKAKTAKAVEAKRAASGTRPTSAQADEDTLPEATTTRGATREVARKLLEELGLDT